MRTVDRLDVSCAEFSQPAQEVRRGFFSYLERKQVLFLIIIVTLAFFVRAYKLDAAGLSEDETNKVFAMRAYEQGDFTVNAEHPMLMKLLCFASTRAALVWNRAAGDHLGARLSEEAAIRLPNALFGALTVIPIMLLAVTLLGFETGVIAALLWTFGLNAVWFNRIGKEDTLLLFFMLLGFYFYNRGKERAVTDHAGQRKLFALAGAAFGLMICSKYFPHYIGLNAWFYTIVSYDRRNNRPLGARNWAVYFAAMVLAFLVCNPAVFYPQTWRYLLAFMHADLLTHHGYLIGSTLYHNDIGDTPFGMPWYFYWLYLAVKVPIPILLAALAGVVEIFRHRGDAKVARGYLFLRFMLVCWLFPMSLLGSKFLRYTLPLTPILYMTAAVGMLAVWRLLERSLRKTAMERRWTRPIAAMVVALIFLVVPITTTLFRALPYPSLYVNAIGGNRVGYFFPHDEFYDLGARESIRYIAEHAPRGATIASEIPGVVQYYLEQYNRPDIQSKIISQPEFSLEKVALDYVLMQRGRTYYENRETFQYIQKHYPLVQSSRYGEAVATQVYQIIDAP